MRRWIPSVFGSAGSSAGDASSADGAPVASDRNPAPEAPDEAPAAEEAENFSMSGSTNHAAPRISAADSRVSVDANSKGNPYSINQNPPTLRRSSHSNPPSTEGSLTRLRAIYGETNWERFRDPNASGTPNPFSSLRGMSSRPFMSAASSERYQRPSGPLRVVNRDSPSDTESLKGFVLPPGITKIQRPNKTYWAPKGLVTREDFDEFRESLEQRLQASATQLLQEKQKGWESTRLKDERILELEGHLQFLQARLERMQRPSGEEEDDGVLREPQTDANNEPLVMVTGTKLIYDTFPHRLREVAVGLILMRAEMAKGRKDWVVMERHGAHAAQVAELLNDRSISGHCEFYRGVALFGLRQWASAHEAFGNAEFCVGVFVSVQEAEEWRQKLVKAIHESPLPSAFPASVRETTPIDQSLFQGSETRGDTVPKAETPKSVIRTSPSVPVITQPTPPSVLRRRYNALQRATYVPPNIQNAFDSTEFNPTKRRAQAPPRELGIRTVNAGDLPLAGSSAVPAFNGISPLNTLRRPQLASRSTSIAESDINGKKSLPVQVTPASKRFSIESGSSLIPTAVRSTSDLRSPRRVVSGGSTRSSHSGRHDIPRRPNRLSVHFEPESKPPVPSIDSETSQKHIPAARRYTPASLSPSDRILPSSKLREESVQLTRRTALSSNPSTGQPTSPLSNQIIPVAVSNPLPPRGTSLSGKSYGSSANMSPQVVPPDLDDNRQEFPVLAVFNVSPQLSSSESLSANDDPRNQPERSVTPLTEGALAYFESRTETTPRSPSAQRPQYGWLSLARGWLVSPGPALETISQVLPPLDQPIAEPGLVPAESGSRASLDADGGGIGGADETIDPTNPSRPEGDEKVNENGVEGTDGGIKNKGNESGQETQPGHVFRYVLRKFRRDPDIDSLYAVSSDGNGNANGPDAGANGTRDDDDERAGADK